MNRTTYLLLTTALLTGCGGSGSSNHAATTAPATTGAAPVTTLAPGHQAGPLPAFNGNGLVAPGAVIGAAPAAPVVTPALPAATPATRPAPTPVARPAATPAATPAARPATPRSTAAPALPMDRDNDGLSDVEERALGTDPTNPDTDSDGIGDGADLGPTFSTYRSFSRSFPAGAVRRGLDVDVLGLGGASRVESWLGRWNTEYAGTKGTRSSDLSPAAVRAKLLAELSRGDYAVDAIEDRGAETTTPQKPRPAPRKRFGRRARFGGEAPSRTQPRKVPEGPALGAGVRTQMQVLGKRYTIDYTFRSAPRTARLRNRAPMQVRDRSGRHLAAVTFPVRVGANVRTEVVLQLTTRLGPGRLGVLFTVLAGPDANAPLAVDGRMALAASIGADAYEVRLPMPTARAAATYTVVAVPVRIGQVGGDVRLDAVDAAEVRIGAAAKIEVVDGANAVQRIAVVSRLTDLAQPTRRPSGPATTAERKTLQRVGRLWRATSTVFTTRRTVGPRGITIEIRTRSRWTQGPDLLALLAPADRLRFGALLTDLAAMPDGFAVLEAARAVIAQRAADGVVTAVTYAIQNGLVDRALQKVAELDFLPVSAARLRSILQSDAVLRGLAGVQAANYLFQGVRAFADQDPLQGGLYLGQVGANALGALGKLDQARVLGGILGGAQGVLGAYRAFASGDHALGLVQVARGAGALVQHLVDVPGVDVTGLVRTALGGVDVAYQLHMAGRERDAIRRQARIERATSAAIDTGIGLIPTVGVLVQAAWSVGFLTATVLDPGLVQWEVALGSPGSLLTLLGTSLFTNEIPSAVAEEAFRAGSEGLVARAQELQQEGRVVVVILPEVLDAAGPTPPRASTPAPTSPAAATRPGADRRRNRRGSARSRNRSAPTSTAAPAPARPQPTASRRGGRGTSRAASRSRGASPRRATRRSTSNRTSGRTAGRPAPRGVRRAASPAPAPAATAAPRPTGGLAAARSRRGRR